VAKQVLAGILVICAVGACAPDPASEAPEKMLPGAYAVNLSGPVGGLGSLAKRKICITTPSDETPKLLVQQFLLDHRGCDPASFERTGNALNGKTVCPVDPRKATGSMATTFTGAVHQNGVEGEINMALDVHTIDPAKQRDIDVAGTLAQAISLTYKATRTGDCDGSEAHLWDSPSASSGW